MIGLILHPVRKMSHPPNSQCQNLLQKFANIELLILHFCKFCVLLKTLTSGRFLDVRDVISVKLEYLQDSFYIFMAEQEF